MQTLKTISIQQLITNSIEKRTKVLNQYLDEDLLICHHATLLLFPSYTFQPNVKEALATSIWMAENEIMKSTFRFIGTIQRPDTGENPPVETILIAKKIIVAPKKTALCQLKIESSYNSNLTQMKLLIRDAFPSDQQLSTFFGMVFNRPYIKNRLTYKDGKTVAFFTRPRGKKNFKFDFIPTWYDMAEDIDFHFRNCYTTLTHFITNDEKWLDDRKKWVWEWSSPKQHNAENWLVCPCDMPEPLHNDALNNGFCTVML